MRRYLPYIYSLIFVIGCYILLPVMNYDYLFEIQEHSLWVKGHTFMVETVNDHGGWLAYIGAYLTQYFYYPWLGTTILVVLWLLIYFFTEKIWEETKGTHSKARIIPFIIPVFLLFHVLSLGYWIYYAKSPGYTFIPTLVTFVITFIGYIINLIVKKYTKDRLYGCINGIILFVITLSVVFTTRKYSTRFAYSTTLSDKNFRAELRMYRAADEGRWEDILAEAPKQLDTDHPKPTLLMVLLKNLALLNTDKLLDDCMKYDNCFAEPQPSDSLKISLASQAGPMLYYHYGLINYSYRWAIENSVKYYPTVDNLKILIRCAIFNQEFDVAMKYISILKSTTFYRSWAREQEAMIHDSQLFMNSREFQEIGRLIALDDELDNDESNVGFYILDHFSNFNSKQHHIEQLSIMSSLLLQQPEESMVHFYTYYTHHQSEPTPTCLQEAAYLIGPTDMSPVDVSKFPFDDTVKMTFNDFNQAYQSARSQGQSDETIASSLRNQFGTSYYWYYYFNPELKFY